MYTVLKSFLQLQIIPVSSGKLELFPLHGLFSPSTVWAAVLKLWILKNITLKQI